MLIGLLVYDIPNFTLTKTETRRVVSAINSFTETSKIEVNDG